MRKDRFEPDAATLLSDDQLLDALGRGERPGKDDDTLTLAFALWREDIDSPAAPVAKPQPARKPVLGKKFRWGVLSGIIAAILGAGGLTVAAASTAEPGSPFWGITVWLFPQRAETTSVTATEQALVAARTAITEQKLDEAEQKVKEAETLIGTVKELTDPLTVQLLQTQLDELRNLLDSARGALGGVLPLPTNPLPGGPVPTPAPGAGGTPQPTPAPTGPTPSPSRTGLLPLPLPTISLPINLPTLPLG